MAAKETIFQKCISLHGVPEHIGADVLRHEIQLQHNVTVVRIDEVIGAEANRNLKRWILELEGELYVNGLKRKSLEINSNGDSRTVEFKASIECELPSSWTMPKVPRNPKPTGRHQFNPQGPVAGQSTVYQNYDAAGGYTSQMSAPHTGASDKHLASQHGNHWEEGSREGSDQIHAQAGQGQEQMGPGNAPMGQMYGWMNPGYGQIGQGQQQMPYWQGHMGHGDIQGQGHAQRRQGQGKTDQGQGPIQMGQYEHFMSMIRHDPNSGQYFCFNGFQYVPVTEVYIQQAKAYFEGQQLALQQQQQIGHEPPPEVLPENSGAYTQESVEPDTTKQKVEDLGKQNVGTEKEIKTMKDPLSKIKLTHLPASVDDDYVQMHLESKRMGSLSVASVVLDNETGSAEVEMTSPEGANNLIEMRTFQMKGAQVFVEWLQVTTNELEEELNEDSTPSIIVTGFPEGTIEEEIRMFFENKRKFEDVEVVDVKFSEDSLSAIITYSSQNDVDYVMNMCPLKLTGTVLKCERHQGKTYRQPESPKPLEPKVLVKGLPENIDEEDIRMFFENKRKFKDVEVVGVALNAGSTSAVITYSSNNDVENVLAMCPVKLMGKELIVERLGSSDEYKKTFNSYSKSSRDSMFDGTQTEILVEDIPPGVDEEMLDLCFSSKKLGSCTIEDIDIDEVDNNAVIKFSRPQDVKTVLDNLPITIKKREVSVQIYVPKKLCTVIVRGPEGVMKEENDDTFEMYFENEKKSGGVDIQEISFRPSEKAFYITYKEEYVAKRVAERDDHCIMKNKVKVELFIPSRSTKVSSEPMKEGSNTKCKRNKEDEHVEPESQPLKTVKIRGVRKVSSRDSVQWYFENKKKADGGDIESRFTDEEDDDVMYIKFKDESDHHQWNKDMLQVETKIAVVDGIQKGTTENELKTNFGFLLHTVKHQVVFNEETTKALLVFENESDMQHVLNTKFKKFQIKQHPRVTKSNCCYVFAKHEVENDCIIQYFLGKKFQRPYFSCEDINGKVKITSQTEYGVDYVISALKGYVCRTYKVFSELKMKVLGYENCRSQLFGTSYIDGEIFIEGETLNLVCRKNSDLVIIDTFIQKILNFEGEKDFQLEMENLSKVEDWCKELEKDGYTSIFLKEEGKLIVLFERWDDVRKVIVKFNALKGWKIKPTGRLRNRDGVTNTTAVTDSQESAPYDLSGVSARLDANWTVDAKDLVDYSRFLPIKVYVYRASICKLNVDCIVNTANGHLSHGAGVAYTIAKDAGEELTKEGDHYIQSHGKIPVGEVAVTKAGRLKYRCVIHAVGPRWHDYITNSPKGVEKCGQDLYNAVMNSFIEANKLQMKSIALPAISSAIFGVPINYCTMKYAKAVLDWCTLTNSGNQKLEEIHFVDVNAVTVRDIQAMFDRMIRNKEPEPLHEIKLLYNSLNRSSRQRSTLETSLKQITASINPKENKQEVALKPFLCKKTEEKLARDVTLMLQSLDLGQKILCYKGDIFNADVNALVVVTDQNCRLGKIVQELKNKIRYEIQSVYASKLKEAIKNAKTGSVFELTGFWQNYQSVFYVVLPYEISKMSEQQQKEVMKETYKFLFEKIYRSPMISSVAMTPLAVYTSDPYEIQLGVDMFWNGFLDHCRRLKDSQPKNLDVHLVCFESYTVIKIIDRLEEVNKALEKLFKDKDADFKTKSDIFMQVAPGEVKEDDQCVICLDKITQPKKLLCGHIFCADCIDQSLGFKECCPSCGRVLGILKGDQPPGQMLVTLLKTSCCYGYEKYGKICIKYTIYDGKQLECHPAPGTPFKGIVRSAYLPDNEQGQNVCRMLKVAFQRKLVFTIGHSHTTGQEGAITWNDIHHKTDYMQHAQFEYPYPSYLDRVTDELQAKGITFADIDPNSTIEEVLESY